MGANSKRFLSRNNFLRSTNRYFVIFSRANIGTFFTSVAIQACGVVTGIVTARLLGPSGRGELATVLLWPTIFSNLGLMGCNWALAREVAKHPDREADGMFAAVAVGIISASIYYVVGFFLLPYLLSPDKRYLLPLARLCLLMIPLDIFNQILVAIEQGRMRWRRYNFVRASFFPFYVVSVFFLWAARTTQVRWFVWVFLVSQSLAVILRLAIQRKSFIAGKLRLNNCARLLRSGLPYFWATGANLLTLQLDKILVVTLLSTRAAGIYVVALTFAGAQSSLGDALGITSFARLSNEQNEGNQQRILTETFRHSSVIAAGLGLVLALLIPFLVVPLFGMEFSEGIRPAVILSIAAAMTTSSGILNEGLRGAGRPYAGLVSQLVGTGVLALTAAVFLKRFGLMGMAWAVVVSSCAQVAVLVGAASNWLRISPFCFWPFRAKDIKIVFHQVAALRLRPARSPA
jgi:O-antigen/teichoic acid export membrane protein